MALLSRHAVAQNCTSNKDTAYFFLLQYELENGRPVKSFFVLKELGKLDALRNITTQKDFICWFYQNAAVFDYPVTASSDFYKCYLFNDDSGRQNFFKSLDGKIQEMHKSFCSYRTRTFPEIGDNIHLNCVKLYGDFWISDTETIISDQVYSNQCLHKPRVYDLKEIFQFWKLTKEEEEAIKFESIKPLK